MVPTRRIGSARGKLALPDWEGAAIHDAIAQAVDELGVGFGKVAMPLRVAVTGGAPSPDLDLTISWSVGRDAAPYRSRRVLHTNKGLMPSHSSTME